MTKELLRGGAIQFSRQIYGLEAARFFSPSVKARLAQQTIGFQPVDRFLNLPLLWTKALRH